MRRESAGARLPVIAAMKGSWKTIDVLKPARESVEGTRSVARKILGKEEKESRRQLEEGAGGGAR
jgi:hypothetical protein